MICSIRTKVSKNPQLFDQKISKGILWIIQDHVTISGAFKIKKSQKLSTCALQSIGLAKLSEFLLKICGDPLLSALQTAHTGNKPA